MKLPTLNIDVSLSLKNLKRQRAQLGKELTQTSQRTLALGGGAFGKAGALAGGLGGMTGGMLGLGSSMLMAATLPSKLADAISSAIKGSVDRADQAMKDLASGKDIRATGLAPLLAGNLAAGSERLKGNEMATAGVLDAFIGAATDASGKRSGIAGAVEDWAQATSEGTKFLSAFTGALLGGKGWSEATRLGDIATSKTVGAAQAQMTAAEVSASQAQIEQLQKAVTKQQKQLREQLT